MTAMIVGAVGFVLVIEGLFYALAPGKCKQMAALVLQLSEEQLRAGGLVAVGAGVLVVWFARVALSG